MTEVKRTGSYIIPALSPELSGYIEAQNIKVQVVGMIPNTRLSIFFDSVNVTQLCLPAEPVENFNSLPVNKELYPLGVWGSPITTDASGTAAFIFRVPENIFKIGVKNISIFNYTSQSDTYENKYSNNSCHAFSTFSGAAFNSTETNDTVIVATAPSTQGCSGNTSSGRTGGSVSYATQPLCQSFYVGSDMAEGQDGIFISSVDLYFSAKSNTQPVVIELRAMSSDAPTESVIPYSTITKFSSNVNIANSETSNNFTKFSFPQPVFLKAGYYYALAVNPGGQSPDYSVWTATVGKTTTSGTVSSNWGQGKLYKSTTNGSNWTPVPNQFLKFNINRTKYDTNFISNGVVNIVNDDYEFLTFINPSNIGFEIGEYVYQQPTAHISIVNVSTSSNTVTLSSVYTEGGLNTLNPTPLSDFSVNDHIVICGSFPSLDPTGLKRFNYNLFGNSQVLKITAINGQSLTVTPNPRFTNSSCFIYKSQSGEVKYSAFNKTVTGIGTRFDFFQNIFDGDRQDKKPLVVHAANNTVARYEVLWPESINTSNNITLKNAPLNPIPTGATAIPISAPVGKVVSIDYTRNLLILNKSTASNATGALSGANAYASPSFFAPGRTLVGTESGATAIVSGIHNIIVNSVQPILQTSIPPGTEITYSANVTTSSNTVIQVTNFDPTITNYFTNNQIVIESRSREVFKNNANKSFTLTAKLSSTSAVLSPTIDLVSDSALLSRTNIIGATAYGEHTNNGNAKSKYISNSVTLREGNEAEDIMVYLTAYKPLGTDLFVFAKILNSNDNEIFEDKDWTFLKQITDQKLYSSSDNQFDYKEYQYTFTTNPITIPYPNLITINNSANIVSSSNDTNWQQDFSNGQLITLYSDVYGSSYEVNRIQTVVSNTQITLFNPVGLANTTSAIAAAMPFPRSAFKNPNNGNIVRYYNTNGSAFDSFRKFAIKVVFTAQKSELVPKIANIRVLAVSV